MDTREDLNMALSPAMSIRSDFSDMDDEALELYLATCVPLSNLPTPPPAKEQPLLPPRPTSPLSAADRPHHSPKLQGKFSPAVAYFVSTKTMSGFIPSFVEVRGSSVPACRVETRNRALEHSLGAGFHQRPTSLVP